MNERRCKELEELKMEEKMGDDCLSVLFSLPPSQTSGTLTFAH
jgi:hypothetical protein